jgi:hypothetical protein
MALVVLRKFPSITSLLRIFYDDMIKCNVIQHINRIKEEKQVAISMTLYKKTFYNIQYNHE